jgi:hypothetical protein
MTLHSTATAALHLALETGGNFRVFLIVIFRNQLSRVYFRLANLAAANIKWQERISLHSNDNIA